MMQIYLIVWQFLDKHVCEEKMTPEICINLLLPKNFAEKEKPFAYGYCQREPQLFSGVIKNISFLLIH